MSLARVDEEASLGSLTGLLKGLLLSQDSLRLSDLGPNIIEAIYSSSSHCHSNNKLTELRTVITKRKLSATKNILAEEEE